MPKRARVTCISKTFSCQLLFQQELVRSLVCQQKLLCQLLFQQELVKTPVCQQELLCQLLLFQQELVCQNEFSIPIAWNVITWSPT